MSLEFEDAGAAVAGRRAESIPVSTVEDTRTDTPFEISLVSPRTRVAIALITLAWIAAVGSFWVWWLEPSHEVTAFGMVITSALLLYLSLFPAGFVIAVQRLRRVNPNTRLPDVRVAFVVTKAPSEPWELVQSTLEAMLDQAYPSSYDVWLCDEDPREETFRWCHEHGVFVSTRRGAPDYHRSEWPRRTKCKEGNLAYFYDLWGYNSYDVVVQLDADHVPAREYLTEMVRPFADQSIGYVAAPSVCDSNAAESWAARGRLYREAGFHGPIQAGHNGRRAPVCIGSHYAVRTSALKEAGGIGPELAEDFTTTFLLNSAGWDGRFAIDAAAHGEGPPTFGAMLTQEFQWSRSLMTVFLGLFFSRGRRLSFSHRLRFAYALGYYPAFGLVMCIGVLLPPVACILGEPWVRVNYLEFVVRWWAISMSLLAMNLLLRHQGHCRPEKTKIISWEGWIYAVVRWPYIAWGVLAAVIQKVVPRPVVFKVTPKGDDVVETLRTAQLAPYLVICGIALVGAAVGIRTAATRGYVFLSLLGAVLYTVSAATVIRMHVVETSRRHAIARRTLWCSVLAPLSIVLALAAAAIVLSASFAVSIISIPGYVFLFLLSGVTYMVVAATVIRMLRPADDRMTAAGLDDVRIALVVVAIAFSAFFAASII